MAVESSADELPREEQRCLRAVGFVFRRGAEGARQLEARWRVRANLEWLRSGAAGMLYQQPMELCRQLRQLEKDLVFLFPRNNCVEARQILALSRELLALLEQLSEGV